MLAWRNNLLFISIFSYGIFVSCVPLNYNGNSNEKQVVQIGEVMTVIPTIEGFFMPVTIQYAIKIGKDNSTLPIKPPNIFNPILWRPIKTIIRKQKVSYLIRLMIQK